MRSLLARAGLLALVVCLVSPVVAIAEPVGESAVESVGSWKEGVPIPLGRIRYGHAQCPGDPGRFYVISGLDSTFNPTITTERFDATTGTWKELAPVPEPSQGPTAVCVGNKIHLFGGGDRFGMATTHHYVYTIGARRWTEAAPVPRPVIGAAAGAYLGRIYLVGGDDDWDPPDVSNKVNVYDIATDRWVGTARPAPHATVFAGSAQSGRYLYLVGGWDDASPAVNVRATQRFDLLTGTWSTGPDLPRAPADFALAVTRTTLYALGGDADGGGYFDASATVRKLDLNWWPAGRWTSARQLPEPVAANNGGFMTAVGFNQRIWTVGGATPGVGIRDFTWFTTPCRRCEADPDEFAHPPSAPLHPSSRYGR